MESWKCYVQVSQIYASKHIIISFEFVLTIAGGFTENIKIYSILKILIGYPFNLKINGNSFIYKVFKLKLSVNLYKLIYIQHDISFKELSINKNQY